MTDSSPTKTVLVCRNKTCSQQGSAKVLAAFESGAPEGVVVKRSGCLGQCGSGPMVLVEPEEVWYSQVHPNDVAEIAAKHLKDDRPVTRKLYPLFHPQETSVKGWLIISGILLGLLLLMFGLLAGQTIYF